MMSKPLTRGSAIRFRTSSVTNFPLMPNQGLTTRPFVRSSVMMDLTELIGMANPIFWAPSKTDELIPITRSSESTSGPPLLPGLKGVVV